MKEFLRTVASYFWDIPVETCNSQVSGRLEVKLRNGRYVLDSAHANYSFGSLHRLFRRIFRNIRLGENPPESVLLLGLGGGSVIHILRKEYRLDIPVTAVESDPEVIRIADRYFGPARHGNVEIVREDAAKFVAREQRRYGMIIVDLFIDDNVPGSFLQAAFLKDCKRILRDEGRIIFNFIKESRTQDNNFNSLLGVLGTLGMHYLEYRPFLTNRVLVIWA